MATADAHVVQAYDITVGGIKLCFMRLDLNSVSLAAAELRPPNMTRIVGAAAGISSDGGGTSSLVYGAASAAAVFNPTPDTAKLTSTGNVYGTVLVIGF